MKKIISLLLVFSMLFGMSSMFISCKPKKSGTTEKEKYVFEHTETVIVDFSDKANIPAELTEVAGEKISQTGGAITLDGTKKEVTFVPTKDLSNGMEFVFWLNSTSDADVKIKFYAMSENVDTDETDSYYAEFNLKKGWNEYRVPFSELASNGTPYGWNNIESLVVEFLKGGNGTVTFDSIRINSQKYGSLKGQQYQPIANAVCFYEDCGLYYYNQFRRSMCPTDEDITVMSDDYTTYVPISVLAEHRGAEDIVATKEKVSFKYNGTAYEFTPDTSVEIVGDSAGFYPGRALSLKPVVSGDHILVPMEKCAEIFGYKLFYDQMGLVIFSDTDNINYAITSDVNSRREPTKQLAEYDVLYALIEDLAYNLRTGEEMIRNMNEMYPENEHPRIGASQADFDRLKGLIKTDPTYKAWFTRYSAQYGKENKEGVFYDSTGYFTLSDGYRLLNMAREVMERIRALSLMYKLTDDKDYADRVYKELNALTNFTDDVTGKKSWQPECFLSTGEIMYGFSLGYDWCYDAFDDEQRRHLETAVWELGYGAAFGWGEHYDWWQNYEVNLPKYEAQVAEEEKKSYYKYVGYRPAVFECTIGADGKPVAVADENGMYTIIKSGNGGYMYKNGVQGVIDRGGVWANNWNAVCNGGMTWMALAFANVESPFKTVDGGEYDFAYWSALLLDCIQASFPYSLKPSYGPDGGYPEGPGYWDYGTTYSMVLLTALSTATGSDNGMFNNPGFGESFYYQCSIGSTSKGIWGYHDAGQGKSSTDIFTAYAATTGDTNIGSFRYDCVTNQNYHISSWDLLYYSPNLYNSVVNMSLDACYNGIDTVTFRSAWDDNAMFCGLHGGANNASHGQHDIGNFILEYAGNRFFTDLGSDEYNLVGYGKYQGNLDITDAEAKEQGVKEVNQVTYFTHPFRHWYYRMRAEGHNTLVINPTDNPVNTSLWDTKNSSHDTNGFNQGNFHQRHNARSRILDYISGTTAAYAVVDMGVAYAGATSGKRGMLVCNNRSTVIVQDELTFSKASEVLWMAHMDKGCIVTTSEDKKSAIITLNGLSLLCTIVTPEGADYDLQFIQTQATYLYAAGLVEDPRYSFKFMGGEKDRTDYTKLVITNGAPKKANKTNDYKVAVVFSLLSDGVYDYQWTDIDDWKTVYKSELGLD